MSIRPIDIQNLLVRLDQLSQYAAIQKSGVDIVRDLQKKKALIEALRKKEGMSTIDQIKDDEDVSRRIEDFKEKQDTEEGFREESRKKRNDRFYRPPDEHIFEKKV